MQERWQVAVAVAVVAAVVYLFATHPGHIQRSDMLGGTSQAPPAASGGQESSAAWTARVAPLLALRNGTGSDSASRRRVDAAKHAELRDAIIDRLWSRALPGAPRPDGGWPVAPLGQTLPRDYVQSRIHDDFVPMARECHRELLAREPDAGGQLYVRVAFVADEELGGVVDSAEITPGTTVVDPAFRRCITDSLMETSFASPENRGSSTISVPVAMVPALAEADAAAH